MSRPPNTPWLTPYLTVARQAYHRAAGLQRLDTGHAQFHGLFDQPVHLVAAGQALRQRDRERGFGLGGIMGANLCRGVTLADLGEGGGMAAALAVEQRDGVAGRQAQHLHMADHGFGQIKYGIGGQRRIDKESGRHQGVGLASGALASGVAKPHRYPSGSSTMQYLSPQNWSAGGMTLAAPAAVARAYSASTSSQYR